MKTLLLTCSYIKSEELITPLFYLVELFKGHDGVPRIIHVVVGIKYVELAAHVFHYSLRKNIKHNSEHIN